MALGRVALNPACYSYWATMSKVLKTDSHPLERKKIKNNQNNQEKKEGRYSDINNPDAKACLFNCFVIIPASEIYNVYCNREYT